MEVIQVLLELGANAHASALDLDGWTPLQLSSLGGHPSLAVVLMLLKHGVDANTWDNSNWTPLHGASKQGHLEVVRVFLGHGADLNSRDNTNQALVLLIAVTVTSSSPTESQAHSRFPALSHIPAPPFPLNRGCSVCVEAPAPANSHHNFDVCASGNHTSPDSIRPNS